MFDSIIFDLDGTLLNSVPDLAQSGNYTLQELALPQRDIDEIAIYIGTGVESLLHRLITGNFDGIAETKIHQKAMRIFAEHYAEHCCDKSFLYDGVIETLAQIQSQGIKMAVVSNKPKDNIPSILKHYQIDHFFDYAFGANSFEEKKPSALPLLETMKLLDSQNCLMVGDSLSDVRAAKAAGMPVACMSYGYNHGQPVADLNPNWVLESFQKLRTILN